MKLRIPRVLRRYSGGAEEVDVSGATVAEAFEDLFSRHPDLRLRVLDDGGRLFPYLLVFRNDEAAALETEVGGADVLELVGAAEGG